MLTKFRFSVTQFGDFLSKFYEMSCKILTWIKIGGIVISDSSRAIDSSKNPSAADQADPRLPAGDAVLVLPDEGDLLKPEVCG